MDYSYRKIRIQYLKAELEFRKFTCESLARKFERRSLTAEQRADLLDFWEDMVRECHKFQAMLDLLEGEETEAALSGMNDSGSWDSQQFPNFAELYGAKDKTAA